MVVAADSDIAPWRRIRYVTTFFITVGVTVAFSMRNALSIAIVAMTNNSTNPDYETFDWNLSTQGTVLSSFFWGYVVTNIPAGLALHRYGARWIFLFVMGICSLASFLIPTAASSGGWEAVCALRVLQGAAQGAVLTSVNQLLSKWAPAPERGRLSSICLSGAQLANIITLPIGGLLASSAGGWPSIFYVLGSLGVVWCAFWLFLGFGAPIDHPYITENELIYIESFYDSQTKNSLIRTPWRSIACSVPMWAVLVSFCLQNWGYYVILTEMPTYMHHVLKFNIKENGALTALPYVAMFTLIYTFGWISDMLIQRKILSLVGARKLFNTIGFAFPMGAMIGLTYAGEKEKDLTVALLVLSAGTNSGVYLGSLVNLLDLSPNFAGILMGIINGIGGCFALIVPIAVGAIITDEESEEQWHTIFWITAGAYFCASISFIILGSADVQSWNNLNNENEEQYNEPKSADIQTWDSSNNEKKGQYNEPKRRFSLISF